MQPPRARALTTLDILLIAGAIVIVVVGSAVSYGYFASHMSAQSSTFTVGQRVSNFYITGINPTNVTGILYMQYPVARANGTAYTVDLGGSVGYACDGTLATLASINAAGARFVFNKQKSAYGCPI
ncbi:MAG: hypothetical protein KGH59_00175 [Candidatus Micrarchaeota archaeon]|nr:hypothetical protein [Candidatus Micrarchaeota archaeon]MDE1804190.1 hypothetical protein [Candidatus Micrarchaeota archaeon]MDE1846702.1 hypothetical protein [Candidatus Micrarchaeota archaeon]